MPQQSDLDWLAAERPAPIHLDPQTTRRIRAELVSYAEGARTERFRLSERLPRPRLRLRHAAYAATTAAAACAALLATNLGGVQRHGGALGVQNASAAPLMRLSAHLADAQAPTGDATLVIRQQTNETGTSSEAELFADNGSFYATPTLAELSEAVNAKETINEGASDAEARDIAAAKAALDGPIAAARHQMSIANLQPGIKPNEITPGAAASAAVLAKLKQAERAPGYKSPSALEQENNGIWMNSIDALVAGAGDPQTRAGVLDLLATIPQVKVSKGTLDGQSTLVLDYSSPTPAPGYQERLILSAGSGVPIELLSGQPGNAPSATSTYKVSRVTVSAIASAGHAGG